MTIDTDALGHVDADVDNYGDEPWPDGPFVLTVHGGKGGIGKTTLAEHLAWWFARRGRTLLVDADTGQQSAMDIYVRTKQAPFDAAAENDPATLGKIRAVPHRFVIIDSPPAADQAAAAIEAADMVLIPIVPRILDIRAIMRTVSGIGDRPHRVVLSRVTTNMGKSRVRAVQEALAGQGVPMLSTIVREYLGPHETARMHNLPVMHPALPDLGKTGPLAASDMRLVWREIAELAGVRP